MFYIDKDKACVYRSYFYVRDKVIHIIIINSYLLFKLY